MRRDRLALMTDDGVAFTLIMEERGPLRLGAAIDVDRDRGSVGVRRLGR